MTSTQSISSSADTPSGLLAREVVEARRFFRPMAERATGALGSACADWWVVGAGFEILTGGSYLQRRDFPYLAVEFVGAGRGRAELGGIGQGLAAGRVYGTGRETRLDLRSDLGRPLRRYYLWLDGPGAEAALATAGLGRARVRVVAAPGEIREAWEWLLREGARTTERSGAVVRVLAEVLLLKLTEANDAGAAEETEGARETFERCRALADGEAARLRGAADLAGAAGLRVETVCRLFRRYADTTPGAYLRMRRIRHAAELLRMPGVRVKEVAAELGFADAFHFSRVFKAQMGVGPRTWRGRHEAG